MRIREDYDLGLLTNYGFMFGEELSNYNDETWELKDKWNLDLGQSRRGQHYYIVIDEGENREIEVYASKPDGDGTKISLGDELFDMIVDGIIVK